VLLFVLRMAVWASIVFVTMAAAATSVSGTVTFVEFSDGTRLGPQKDGLWSWFKLLRNRRAVRYRQLLEAYNVGGGTAPTESTGN